MDHPIRPLPFKPDSLNGLSETLIRSHHENNYAGAARRLNAIRQSLGTLDWAAAPGYVINGLKREELMAANSAYLHELYFAALGGDGVLPACGLSVGLERDFGSVARWREAFVAMAKAMGGGSGWALLSWSSHEARLINHWAADHTHLLGGATPLLALDMYEHAYHLDFGAKAGAYVDAFMDNLHWQGLYQRYGQGVQADAAGLGLEKTAVPTHPPQLLDVRRAEDRAAHPVQLPGTTWHDPAQVAQWSSRLDPAQPVLLYCLRGKDIGQSTALALRARGFEARYLAGGIEGWAGAGLPLEQA